jgi:hypothetical protein
MNARLTPLDGKTLSDATLYRQLVSSLVYLTVTHPDIAHAVHLVSQILPAPHSTHYAAVIHILRYIKGVRLKVSIPIIWLINPRPFM